MAETTKAGRIKVFYVFLLLFGPALLLIFISTRGCQHKFKTLEDYGAASDYKIISDEGRSYTSRDFKGDVVLVTTLQETCPDSCAISFWHLDQSIYQHIRKNRSKKLKRVRIISFVTDGKGNPVEDLSVIRRAVEDNVEEYDPSIWILAKGDARAMYDFERNGQSLIQEGDAYYGGQGFQELMLLLDKKNHLRMVLSGKTEGMVRRMKEHIALLQKQYDKERAEKQN
jgi:hypothetical protein